jgi:hypothetical protein
MLNWWVIGGTDISVESVNQKELLLKMVYPDTITVKHAWINPFGTPYGMLQTDKSISYFQFDKFT